jgi:hypothetical protein
MLAGQVQEALPLWNSLQIETNARALGALVLCQIALGVDVNVPSVAVAAAANREFGRWYWRLVEFGAEPVVLLLHENVGALEQVLPDAAELVRSVIAKLAVAEAV